jgi:hypothetical protein
MKPRNYFCLASVALLSITGCTSVEPDHRPVHTTTTTTEETIVHRPVTGTTETRTTVGY